VVHETSVKLGVVMKGSDPSGATCHFCGTAPPLCATGVKTVSFIEALMTFQLTFTPWAVPLEARDLQTGDSVTIIGFRKKGSRIFWIDSSQKELCPNRWTLLAFSEALQTLSASKQAIEGGKNNG
jgi:hypothetical protein